jgi:hypothetical protein
MAVNFNAMILPKFGSSFMEGDTARQNALLKDQQMANTQQEMQFRGEERAYVQKQRAEDQAYLSNLREEITLAGGKMTPEVITQLARSPNPQERAIGIEAMERARRLASQRAAVEQLFPEPPQYKPTFGGAQFGDEAPKAYNALIPQGAQNTFSPGEGLPMSGNQPQFRTRGEFRGAMANPERATAAMAAGMRTIPAAFKDLLADPDTRAMALSLLEKEQKDIPEAKLIALRDSFPVNSKNYKQIDDIISIKGMPTQNVQVLPGVGTFASAGRVPLGTAPGATRTGDAPMVQKETVVLAPDNVTPIRVTYPGYSGLGDKDPFYIGPAVPNAGQAKVSREQQKLEDSLFSLEENLQDYRSAYERLNQLGGIPSTQAGVVSNVANQLANTTAGGWVATALGSEAQVERDTIANTKRLLTQDIAGITGIGSKQLDSNQELQAMLKTLGTPGQSIEAVNATFDSIMRWAQSKARASRRRDGGGAAPATGGGKPPATGGGKPDVTGLPAGATLGKATSKGIEVLDSTGKLIGHAQQ